MLPGRLIAIPLLSLAMTGHAAAQSAPATDLLTGSSNGTPFVSGGVGQEQQAAIKALRADYNLLLTFANKSGEYRANVEVAVLDQAGNVRFAENKAGPLLYMRLAPGSYRVDARSEGVQQTRQVSVPAGGQRELAFTWD
ncbi:carboxypeptidase regulatory-like domain-containing protein [Massilia endophytica]|uniref:carboxypeptidase regulatory-like domain-containing protein n=1 Tax=Massilia endophytica TaxID=2899220 RepID=UPI001E2B295F|nr:carboxypeptidase regulatory-like domain-containing protein [Massilia endophytica]UGQ48694.1 carboxypeptidase regulatory-like domain-containing protein [Massilia endophytica]